MKSFIGLFLVLWSGMALAAEPVSVTHAWVAATAPGQVEGAAYMDISSNEDAKLVAASSPVASKVDVHIMTMKNGIMEMRPVKVLDIPAGKTVNLAPGKMHLMLMDVKKPLVPGDKVSLKLSFMQGGKKSTLDVEAPVMSMADHMDMH